MKKISVLLLIAALMLPLFCVSIYADGTASFTSAQVMIGTDLTVRYTASVTCNVKESVTAKFTREGETVEITGVPQGNGIYTFDYEGINPQCMGDNIKAELYVDGLLLDEKDDYSVKQNVMNLYNKSSDPTLKNLLIATLNFGASAQKYAQYKTDELVNEDVDGIMFTYDTPYFEDRSSNEILRDELIDPKITGAGIYFDNAFHVYFTVKASDIASVDGYIYEGENSGNGTGTEFISVGKGVYRVISSPVSILELETQFGLQLSTTDGPTLQVVKYGVSDYIARMEGKYQDENMENLIYRLIDLYGTAKEYAAK